MSTATDDRQVFGLAWVWEDGRWQAWPYPGRQWRPIDTVAGDLRTLAHLLKLKGTKQDVLIEQAAWVRKGSGWVWVRGADIRGEASVVGQALRAEVAQAASWARA